MANFVFVPARPLIPLPRQDEDPREFQATDDGVVRGRHVAAWTSAARRDTSSQRQTPRTAVTEHGLTTADRDPGMSGPSAPAGQDPLADAMDWLGQLRDGGYPGPQGDTYGAPLRDNAYTQARAYHGSGEPLGDNRYAEPLAENGYAAAQPDDPYVEPGHANGYPTAAGPAPAKTKSPVRVPPWSPGQRTAADTAQAAGQPHGCVLTCASVEITQPAVIGDALRMPIAWCEMGNCVSHYSHPQALGQADIRRRAIAAGWRADALERLICPTCQQHSSRFLATRPVRPWDRHRAIAVATLMVSANGRQNDPARAKSSIIPAAQPIRTPAPARGRHRERR